MFTQSTMHFCACKYPLLPLQWRYLLPGATPNCLQLTSAFLSWQRLRNCLCKFHSCKYPERSNPHAAPSKPYPLLPPPLSLSFLALESTYFSFFFWTARLPLLPSHSYSLPVRRPFYTSQYQPLSTLHCLPFPSLPLPTSRAFLLLLLLPGRIFIVNVNVARGICIATFVWQHSKCSYLYPLRCPTLPTLHYPSSYPYPLPLAQCNF